MIVPTSWYVHNGRAHSPHAGPRPASSARPAARDAFHDRQSPIPNRSATPTSTHRTGSGNASTASIASGDNTARYRASNRPVDS